MPDKRLQRMQKVKQTGVNDISNLKQALNHMLAVSAGIDTERGRAVLVKTATVSSPLP